MPCNHRFIDDLYPKHKLKHLFIGTFNPTWENPNGNNANWFYGRRTNSFWRILPGIFNHPNMNNALHRQNINLWKQYCVENNIGITEIIESINDANENNEDHRQRILGFQDNDLEVFENVKFTKIEKLINKNVESLCGVYLTRYSHTLPANGIFGNRWKEIESFCNEKNIHISCLVTPSNGYMMPVNQKIAIWQQEINICK